MEKCLCGKRQWYCDDTCNKSNMEQLIENIEKWANEKDLLKEENTLKQFTKVVEEIGEVAEGLAKDNRELIEDGIGDTMVTLIILAAQKGMSIEQCLTTAWEEIKDRTGETKDGVFIKS